MVDYKVGISNLSISEKKDSLNWNKNDVNKKCRVDTRVSNHSRNNFQKKNNKSK